MAKRTALDQHVSDEISDAQRKLHEEYQRSTGEGETADAFADAMRSDDGSRTSWKPMPGDFLIGVVVYRRDNVASRRMLVEEYEPCTVLGIRDERTGEVVDVWGMHSTLRNEIRSQNPGQGERVGIKYHGVKCPEVGKEYHHWTFRVDR